MPLQAVFRVRAALEIARGLAHVHARGWMHRDLKGRARRLPSTGFALAYLTCRAGDNVLLVGTHATVQLCDFGMAARADGEGHCKTLCGTHEYMAPELHTSEAPYGFSADAHASGVCR